MFTALVSSGYFPPVTNILKTITEISLRYICPSFGCHKGSIVHFKRTEDALAFIQTNMHLLTCFHVSKWIVSLTYIPIGS